MRGRQGCKCVKPARPPPQALTEAQCWKETTVVAWQVLRDFWDTFKPGGRLHPTYILEHQWHLVFEAALSLVVAYLLFQRSSKRSRKQEKPLSEQVAWPAC